MIVEIPKIEVKQLVEHLGEFPIRSHLYHAYQSLKAALDLDDDLNQMKRYSKEDLAYEQKMRDIKTPPEKKAVDSEKRPFAVWTCLTPEEVKSDLKKIVAQEKTVTSEKPSPLAMAREFIKKNPDATATDVNKFLLDNFVKPTTASATAYKLFRKN